MKDDIRTMDHGSGKNIERVCHLVVHIDCKKDVKTTDLKNRERYAKIMCVFLHKS